MTKQDKGDLVGRRYKSKLKAEKDTWRYKKKKEDIGRSRKI